MSFIEIKLIKLKNMHKYFVFHISNKNPKICTNYVNLFSKDNLKFVNNLFQLYNYYIYIF